MPNWRRGRDLMSFPARTTLSTAIVLGLGLLAPISPSASAASITPASAPRIVNDHMRGSPPGLRHRAPKGPAAGEGTQSHHHKAPEDRRLVVGVVTAVLGTDGFRLAENGSRYLDVQVSSATTYSELGGPSGTTVGLEAVTPGDSVRVKGRPAGPGTLDAVSVVIPTALATGVVQSATGSQVTISPAISSLTSSATTIVANITTGTVYRYPGTKHTGTSVVKPGDFVSVQGSQEGSVPGGLGIDAKSVTMPLLSFTGVAGALDRSTNSFPLALMGQGLTVSVELTTAAKYKRFGHAASSSATVIAGKTVLVTGAQDGADSVIATMIEPLGGCSATTPLHSPHGGEVVCHRSPHVPSGGTPRASHGH